MQRQAFDYDLPPNLIASYPPEQRTDSRLLALSTPTGKMEHVQFYNIIRYLRAGDLLVLNDSRVFAARLYGKKQTGGAIEVLVERVLDQRRALAHIRASKAVKVDHVLKLADKQVRVLARREDLFELALCSEGDWFTLMSDHGQIPLQTLILSDL